jgi:hypothetical protein
MRNCALRGCLIAIAALLAVAFLSSKDIGSVAMDRIQPHSNPIEHQQPSEADKRGTIDAPFVVKAIPTEKSKQEAEEDARDKDDKRWNDRAAIFISIATGLILLLQLFVFGWQAISLRKTIVTMKELGTKQSADMQASIAVAKAAADAAKESADISRVALISTQRAYVSANIDSVPFIEKDGPLKGFAFSIKWQNKGPTRAINLQNFVLIKRFEPDVPENFDFAAPPGQGFEGQTSVVIDSNSDAHSSNALIPLSDIELAVNNTGTIYLWGAAIYNDVFPETVLHHVYVCVRVRIIRDIRGKENPFTYEVYKNYNKAD